MLFRREESRETKRIKITAQTSQRLRARATENKLIATQTRSVHCHRWLPRTLESIYIIANYSRQNRIRKECTHTQNTDERSHRIENLQIISTAREGYMASFWAILWVEELYGKAQIFIEHLARGPKMRRHRDTKFAWYCEVWICIRR